MSNELKDLDPVPLVERLLEKSLGSKLSWEPTADPAAFVTTVGAEATFRIRLVNEDDMDDFGRPTTVQVPRLEMLDDKGRLLWDVRQSQIRGTALRRLYDAARRIGNRLDERLATALQALERL